MNTSSSISSTPIELSSSTEAKVYGLVALAMGLTLVGVFLGIVFANQLLSSGLLIIMLFVNLGIIFTSRWWINSSPLNIILFGVFPLLAGITLTPYIMYVLMDYVDGAAILFDALAATVCMSAAAAVFARTTRVNLQGMRGALLTGLIGLLVLGILQIFFPALQTGVTELLLSGFGVILFAAFLAYDIQRIQRLSRVGASPFLLALSLYLDIYNLFLYILRFILALSGGRRR